MPIVSKKVVANEANTVFYYAWVEPTFDEDTVSNRYIDYAIKYVSGWEGYDLLLQWLNDLENNVNKMPLEDNDIVYIDFPWLTTKDAIKILDHFVGKEVQVYYISAREMNEYPVYEDEDGNPHSLEDYFVNDSGNIEFYKLQTNEVYDFVVNSAKETIAAFDNELDGLTFFFDSTALGTSFVDNWKEMTTPNKFACQANCFYIYIRKIAEEAGFAYDDIETILKEFEMYNIEIYINCEGNNFVRLSRFFDESPQTIDELYEQYQFAMDIDSIIIDKSVTIILGSNSDDDYKKFLHNSQVLYYGEYEDVDARTYRPLIFLYTNDEIEDFCYINQTTLSIIYGNTEEEIKETLFDTISAEDVADYIRDNLDRFVYEYNSATSENWQAVGIDGRHSIIILENNEEKEGVFFDFNDDKGYAVIGENNHLYDLQTSGESPFKGKSFSTCYYSMSTGYLYKQNDEILSVNDANNADDSFLEEEQDSKHYAGQASGATGCGKIENVDKYVADKYGSEWKKGNRRSLKMQGYKQYELSCYFEQSIEDTENYPKSEGNCWAVSAYTVLQYMADQWGDMPQSSEKAIDYKPATSEPNIYSLYFSTKDGTPQGKNTLLGSIEGNAVYKYSLGENIKFPKLYTNVREYINKKFKKIDGGMIWRSCWIVSDVAEQYGHDVGYKIHLVWGAYLEKSTSEIADGRPLLLSTSNDTYGSHTMAVCGYVRYQKTKTFWRRFVIIRQKIFYEIKDGGVEDSRYYDMSGHFGIASIVSFNY